MGVPRDRRWINYTNTGTSCDIWLAIVGPRQAGKTTLAADIRQWWPGSSAAFDLEDPGVLASVADPMLTLRRSAGWSCSTRSNRLPELFPVLRVLADRPRSRPGIWYSAVPRPISFGSRRSRWQAVWRTTNSGASRSTGWATAARNRSG